MKICIIGPKAIPYPAGIENFVTEIGRRLVRNGHEVIVYVRKHYYNYKLKSYEGIKLIYTPGISSKNFDTISHTFTATLHALIFVKPDIFYFHGVGVSPLILLPRIFKKKVALHTHGLDAQRSKWGSFAKAYLRFCQYTSSKLPDIKMSISSFEKRYYGINYHSKFVNIPTGVQNYKYIKSDIINSKYGLQGKDYILFLSRLVPEKGCHYLIEAYNSIYTNFKLVIAGDNRFSHHYIKSLKEKSTDNENIIFTGFVKGGEMEELFANCLFFIQPSEIEGLPHSILQALSFGKFVLASNIPGNREALGPLGLKFEKGNIEDLTEKINYILENKEKLCSNNIERLQYIKQNYNWDTITNKIERQLKYAKKLQ